MDRTSTYYRIGPHVLRIGSIPSLDPNVLLPSFAPFVLLSEERKDAEEFIEVDIYQGGTAVAEDTFPEPVSFEWENACCTLRRRKDGNYQIGIAPLKDHSIEAYADSTDGFCRNTVFIPEVLHSMAPFLVDNFLMMIYTFATAGQGTLMVHASVIQYNGYGYLFLGKSGTGKSTHTRLWLRHIEGCRLLNDDNPVVAIDPHTGQVIVYGTPWSGKTPCYLNESVPVRGFIRLEQAQENSINRLTSAYAFAALLPSCSCLKQDSVIYNGIIDTVTDIATRIPIYNLRCLPDEAAALLCMQAVTKRGEQLL